jgi:hypothetical protein
MKEYFSRWWDNGSKNFSIRSFRDDWSKNGVGMHWCYGTNGAKPGTEDTCLDACLTLGYLTFNYTNFDYK